MINTCFMHLSNHFSHTGNQRLFDCIWWRIIGPIFTIIFKTNRWRKILCHNERSLFYRVKASFPISDTDHCVNTNLLEFVNSAPLITGPKNRPMKRKNIFEKFFICYSVVKFQIVSFSFRFKSNRLTSRHGPI